MTAAWNSGDAYEQYVGRWSRIVATEFLRWLAPRPGLAWADVGCGTGALASRISDPRARFETGDATHLPWNSAVRDVTAAGLVLNFVRDHEGMVREMARVTRPGETVAAYVWDYAGGMQMVRRFWDAAIAVSPNDAKLDQAEQFPVCQPGALQALFEKSGLKAVETRAIEIPTVFQTFDDYWKPFLGRTGAAPSYLASVDGEVRERIRLDLESRLAPTPGSPIELTARAWAVRGVV